MNSDLSELDINEEVDVYNNKNASLMDFYESAIEEGGGKGGGIFDMSNMLLNSTTFEDAKREKALLQLDHESLCLLQHPAMKGTL